MAIKTKKTFEYLLESGQNQYKSLFDKVNKLQQLDSVIKSHLPHPLGDYCRVANLRQGRLVLAVDSPVWATKLRFYGPELLSNLRQDSRFAGLTGIDISVAPEGLPAARVPRKLPPRKPMSASNRQMMANIAKTIQDERLKKVFNALAGED